MRFGQDDSGWAYTGDSAAIIDEGWSPAPLVEAGDEFDEPGYWLDVMGRAIQPMAPAQQPVVIVEQPTPLWAWALGGVAVVLVIKALQ
jgi:hypothetical protein